MERFNETRTTDEYKAHCAEIARLVALWQRGEISVTLKRASIAMENAQYYGTTGTALTSEPQVIDEVAHVLSAGMNAPVQAVSAALHARRMAGHEAAHADDLASAREASGDGDRSYQAILRAAS